MLTRSKLKRMVEGQVLDFMKQHPQAVSRYWRAEVDGKPRIVGSLSKRIVGELASTVCVPETSHEP